MRRVAAAVATACVVHVVLGFQQTPNEAGNEEARRLHHMTETDSERQIPDEERQALVDLYGATNGDDWLLSRGWLTLEDPCTWYGIVCTDNHTGILEPEFLDTTRIREVKAGHVVEINLPNNNLVGFIPASISEFRYLRHLYLDTNSIIGPLPSTFVDLEYLTHARLWNNVITGPLPSNIGNLRRLQYLNLARNQLTGAIPESIVELQQLSVLYLSQNFLGDPVPSGLTDRETMPRLKTLYLHKNEFAADVGPACKERYCNA